MIILHRTRESRRADEIQQKLEDLVAAHEVRYEAPEGLSGDISLPVLTEGEDFFAGDDIDARLEELEGGLVFSRQISGDACYMDPAKPGDCL